MANNLLLRIVGLFILFPTTLVAAFGSLPGVMLSVGAIRDGFLGWLATLWLVALAVGWFGIVTLWRLYYSFLRGNYGFNRWVAWAGLACGSVVSVALIATAGGPTLFKVLFFGWPLLSVAFFAFAMLRSQEQPNRSSKRTRERPRAA